MLLTPRPPGQVIKRAESPAAGNAHEITERAVPGARVVYADNDRLVMTYATALLTISRPTLPQQ